MKIPGMAGGSRLGEVVQLVCVAIVVTVAIFVGINLVLDPFVPSSTASRAPRQPVPWSEAGVQEWLDRYGIDVLRRTYPGRSDDELKRVLYRKVDAANHYEPFLEFLQDPVFLDLDGHLYGVHEAGFRFGGRDQGPWPIDKTKLNVFLFGSSTAFGAGASDDETISAILQQEMRAKLGREVNVYNFAVGAYYSSQELIDFWRLARDGIVPDLVVFVDGMNDYFQMTEDTAHSGFYRDFEKVRVSFFQQLELDRGMSWHLGKIVQTSAVGRLVSRLAERQTLPSRPGEEAIRAGQPTVVRSFNDADKAHVDHATDRLINNFNIESGMAQALGAEIAFVIQPDPMYEYDLSHHPFAVPEEHQYTKIGYPILRERLETVPFKGNVAWCADLQRDVPADVTLYIDPVHYTVAMNKLIAGCILDNLDHSGSLLRFSDRIK